MGSIGANRNTPSTQIDDMIREALTGNEEVPIEEIRDIQVQTYGIKTSNLSESDRKQLSNIVENTVGLYAEEGVTSNSPSTVVNIQNGKITQISLNQMSQKDLIEFIKLMSKVHTRPAVYAYQDALTLLRYKNQ